MKLIKKQQQEDPSSYMKQCIHLSCQSVYFFPQLMLMSVTEYTGYFVSYFLLFLSLCVHVCQVQLEKQFVQVTAKYVQTEINNDEYLKLSGTESQKKSVMYS